MNEEEMRNVPPEEEVTPPEEVVLPPLPPQPVEAPAQEDVPPPPPTEPEATAPEETAAVAPPPAEEKPPEQPEVPTPPAEAELPDQQQEEEKVFKRPRTIKDLREGMVLEGKVTSVAIYGAFVDIGVGREGLVHISQLSEESVSTPTEVVSIGDMVTVRVLNVDPRSRRISLTMREKVEPELDREKLRALTPGTIMEGTVTSLARFGAFVDIGVGRDGLIPISQLGPGEVQRAGDVLQVGERVRVRVVDVDQKNARIRLSMRNVYDPELIESLRSGSIVQGQVTSLAPFGAFVDIGVGKDGLIHISEMGEAIRHPQDLLQVGQEIEARVVDVDLDTQRIGLSLQLEEEEEWEPDWTEEEEEELPAEATLEDLVARFSSMRPTARGEESPRKDRGERDKRAVREALQRTLEGMREQEEA